MAHDCECLQCLHTALYTPRLQRLQANKNNEREALRKRLRAAVFGLPLLYATLFMSLYLPPQLLAPPLKFVLVMTYTLVIAMQSYALLTMPL